MGVWIWATCTDDRSSLRETARGRILVFGCGGTRPPLLAERKATEFQGAGFLDTLRAAPARMAGGPFRAGRTYWEQAQCLGCCPKKEEECTAGVYQAGW